MLEAPPPTGKIGNRGSDDPVILAAAVFAVVPRFGGRQLLRHLLHVDRLALVGEGGVAGDDKEPRQPGDCRCDLLDRAVDEIFLFRVTRHVLERQHGQ